MMVRPDRLLDHDEAGAVYSALQLVLRKEYSVAGAGDVIAAAGFDITKIPTTSEGASKIGRRTELFPALKGLFNTLALEDKNARLRALMEEFTQAAGSTKLDAAAVRLASAGFHYHSGGFHRVAEDERAMTAADMPGSRLEAIESVQSLRRSLGGPRGADMYAEMESLRSRCRMVIHRLFGDDSHYLAELREVAHPSSPIPTLAERLLSTTSVQYHALFDAMVLDIEQFGVGTRQATQEIPMSGKMASRTVSQADLDEAILYLKAGSCAPGSSQHEAAKATMARYNAETIASASEQATPPESTSVAADRPPARSGGTTAFVRVLIASPSDVPEYRDAAATAMRQWNALHAERQGVVFLSFLYEDVGVPDLRSQPQDALNQQLVDRCDMAIAIFWSRLGTQTEQAESGTAEEVERQLARANRVLLYVVEKPLPYDHNREQFGRLQNYLEETKDEGYIQTGVSNADQFREFVSRALHTVAAESAQGDVHHAPSVESAATSAVEGTRSGLAAVLTTWRLNWETERDSGSALGDAAKSLLLDRAQELLDLVGSLPTGSPQQAIVDTVTYVKGVAGHMPTSAGYSTSFEHRRVGIAVEVAYLALHQVLGSLDSPEETAHFLTASEARFLADIHINGGSFIVHPDYVRVGGEIDGRAPKRALAELLATAGFVRPLGGPRHELTELAVSVLDRTAYLRGLRIEREGLCTLSISLNEARDGIEERIGSCYALGQTYAARPAGLSGTELEDANLELKMEHALWRDDTLVMLRDSAEKDALVDAFNKLSDEVYQSRLVPQNEFIQNCIARDWLTLAELSEYIEATAVSGDTAG
jgi:hypothetical protein